MNPFALAEKRIKKDSNIKIHKLAAIAMTRGGHFITCETNKAACGSISDFSVHAEEGLVRKLRKINAINRYSEIVVVVLRLSRSGWRMARPCNRCEGLLVGYGVKEIHYTNELGHIIKLKGI
jgi:cytidine deaminase